MAPVVILHFRQHALAYGHQRTKYDTLSYQLSYNDFMIRQRGGNKGD